MEKQKIILDTDISNEIDDQFALVYLMKSLDEFDVQAITIAPFSTNKWIDIKNLDDGLDISTKTTKNLLKMLGQKEYSKKIYKGASKFFAESKKLNPASKKIIQIAKENEMTTIISIGTPTNLAIAFEHAPEIAKKLKVVWLGGHSFLADNNDEYNFKQDVQAVKKLFASKCELVVIPCKNVASHMMVTRYEIEHYLSDKGEIGQYLCSLISTRFHGNPRPKDLIGHSKILWDISAVAYCVNKNWFECEKISCPEISDDLRYEKTLNRHKVTFAKFLYRDKIFQDFFIKMGAKTEKKEFFT